MNIIKSELLKYRRTFAKKLILLMPIFFVVLSLILRIAIPGYKRSWDGILVLVFNWWTTIFLPLGIGVFAGLVAEQEKKSGNYKGLLCRNISPRKIWYGKIFAMAIYTFLSSLVLILAIIISGFLTSEGSIPLNQIILGSLVSYIPVLILIPIQLWASSYKGIILSIAIAFIGMLGGVIISPEKFWFFMPWSWASRLIAPIIGVHPNGTILPTGDLLLSTSVIIPGLILSIIGFIVVVYISGIWFERRKY